MLLNNRLARTLILGCICSPVWAGELPVRFTLGRHIPDNVWAFMNFAPTPERTWVDEQIGEVFQALKDSGIDRDIVNLVLSFLDEGARKEAQAKVDRTTELFNAVRWGDAFAGEVAFAERISSALPTNEYVLLARSKEGTAEANAKALAALVQEVSTLTDKLTLSQRTVNGVEEWSLSVNMPPHDAVTIFCLLRKGDLIELVFAPSEKQVLIDLLAGKEGTRAIVDTSRFQQAMSLAKDPEHGVMYFDFKTLLTQMHGLFERMQELDDSGCDPEKTRQFHRLIDAIVKRCDVLDYSLVTMEMNGRQEFTSSFCQFQEGKQDSPLAQVFLERRPFDRFDRYIPADATGFSLDGFIDLERLYVLVIDFVREHVPGGNEHLATWNGWLANVGFDPTRDIFSWWSGETISISLPPAVVTPMGGSDFVLMIRVKDTELARTKINAAIDFLHAKLQGRGLLVSAANVGDGNFREVTHPSLMMMGIRPVIGIEDGWLIMASSAATVKKCQAVASGEAPSIMKNERFRKEGLVPHGPVHSASFKDTSKFGQETAQIMMMAGGMGQLFVANLPEEPGNPESGRKKAVLRTILSTLTKLGTVLQKVDFLSSESCVTTVNGTMIRSEKVVTYKGPPSVDAPQTADADSKRPRQ